MRFAPLVPKPKPSANGKRKVQRKSVAPNLSTAFTGVAPLLEPAARDPLEPRLWSRPLVASDDELLEPERDVQAIDIGPAAPLYRSFGSTPALAGGGWLPIASKPWPVSRSRQHDLGQPLRGTGDHIASPRVMRQLDVGDVDDPLEQEADEIADQVMRQPSTSASDPGGAAPAGILPKLEVGDANDPLEREADEIADQVMRTPASSVGGFSSPGGAGLVQRKCASCEAEDDELRRELEPGTTHELVMRACSSRAAEDELRRACVSCSVDDETFRRACTSCETEEDEIMREPGAGQRGGTASHDFTSQVRQRRHAGRPLPNHARGFLEPRLGLELGDVRVHSDAAAGSLAKRINARAFTLEQDIFFAPGEFRPSANDGMRLLAHEVAHTLQNRGAVPSSVGIAPENDTSTTIRRGNPPVVDGSDEPDNNVEFDDLTDLVETIEEDSRDLAATATERARLRRYYLLLADILDPESYPQLDEEITRLDAQVSISESATLNELDDDDVLDDEPSAFPETWADELQESAFVLTPAYDELTKTTIDTWAEMQKVGDAIPEYLLAHGLPVDFETALIMSAFDLDWGHYKLAQDHAIRQYLDGATIFLHAHISERAGERFQNLADGLTDAVRKGEAIVNTDAYSATPVARNLAELLTFGRTTLGQDLQAFEVGLATLALADALLAWEFTVVPIFNQRLGNADALIAESSRGERSWYAAKWAWEHDYGWAATLMIAEKLEDAIADHGGEMLAMGSLIIVAQHIPYVNIAVDIGLLATTIYSAIEKLEAMRDAEEVVRSAKTVVDLQRAAAQRDLVDIEGGATLLMDLIGGRQAVKTIRKKVEIRPNHPVKPRSEHVLTPEFQTWLKKLSPETQTLLRKNPELRAVFEQAPPHVRRLLTKCNTPCIPPNAQPEEIAAITKLLEDKNLDGANQQLKNYFYKRRKNLTKAVSDLQKRTDADLEIYRQGSKAEALSPATGKDLEDLGEFGFDLSKSGVVKISRSGRLGDTYIVEINGLNKPRNLVGDEATRAVAIEMLREFRNIEEVARKSGAKYVQVSGSSIINKATGTKGKRDLLDASIDLLISRGFDVTISDTNIHGIKAL